jgi:DNA-binding NarL/FixJ family response regulator
MILNKIKALKAEQQKIARQQAAIEAKFNAQLAALPAQYGFASADDFIAALKAAAGSGGRSVKAAGKVKRGRPAGGGGRRKRTKITEEMRAQVGELVKAGKTNEEVAAQVGISAPSVQNIKKSLGLVKAREA